jgi:hypothetical protein
LLSDKYIKGQFIMTDMVISGMSISGGFTVTLPPQVPGAPTIGTATATSATTATVAFTAPASDGGATITSYTATSNPGNITGTLNQAGSGTITVSGLSSSTSYTFTVTATNSVGTGSASSASNSITTPSSGTPPVNTVAPVVSGTATLGQTLSTTNGTWTGTATITYTYQWQRGGGSSYTNITSATNSTYTLVQADVSLRVRCVVTGTNGVGNSSANSNATSDVSPNVPGAPTGVAATVTSTTSVLVAYTAPSSNGGSTITSYTATSSPGGITGTVSQSGSGTIAVTGLTTNTSYTFTVTATNIAGTGSASSPSAAVTPAINNGYIALLTANTAPSQAGAMVNSSGFYVGELWRSDNGSYAPLISKFNSYGSPVWQKSITGSGLSIPDNCLTLDSTGNVYAAIANYLGYPSYGNQLVLFKYDSDGNILWQFDLQTPDAVPAGLTVDSSNNVYIILIEYISGVPQGLLAKFDGSDGTLLWQRSITETNGFLPKSIAINGSSVYVVAEGYPNVTYPEGYIVKYDTSGTLQWQKVVSSPGGASFFITTVTTDSSGNIYIAGQHAYEAFLAKYDSTGVEVWQQFGSAGTSGGVYTANDITIDSTSGNIYMIGTNDTTQDNVLIAKVATSDGSLVWYNTLTSNVGNTVGLTISLNASKVFISSKNDATPNNYTVMAQLKNDGTLTGTYTVGSYSYTYESQSGTWNGANTTIANSAVSNLSLIHI